MNWAEASTYMTALHNLKVAVSREIDRAQQLEISETTLVLEIQEVMDIKQVLLDV